MIKIKPFLYKRYDFNVMTKQEIDMRKWNGKLSHCKHHIRYHLIFVTKYRRKCLNEIRQDIFDVFRYVQKNITLKM